MYEFWTCAIVDFYQKPDQMPSKIAQKSFYHRWKPNFFMIRCFWEDQSAFAYVIIPYKL